MKRLLIVRLGAVGDGLMLAPVLALLRSAHPTAYIEVAGAIWRLRLLVDPTLADVVTPIEDFFRNDHVIRAKLDRFDRIVVFAIDLEAPIVRAIASAAPQKVELHYSFPMSRTSDHHVIDHIQRSISHLGIEGPADRRYRLPIPNSARQFGEHFLAEIPKSGRRVYIQAGTKIETKRWPNERFVTLCRDLANERSCQIFMGCGPLDEKTVDAIEQGLSGVTFVRARGQDLLQTAGVLSHMDLCIGIDSGITHLAAMVGAPTLAIFGATRPELWGPVGPQVRVLVGTRGLDCCTQDHPRICEGGCMEEVSTKNVLDAADEMLSGGLVKT